VPSKNDPNTWVPRETKKPASASAKKAVTKNKADAPAPAKSPAKSNRTGGKNYKSLPK